MDDEGEDLKARNTSLKDAEPSTTCSIDVVLAPTWSLLRAEEFPIKCTKNGVGASGDSERLREVPERTDSNLHI
jgi:hypothetical protein